jgi:hypothetical protein
MIQGTTPTHYFTLPFDTSLVKSARVIYSQNEKVILKKELSDCQCDANTISCKLTQEETFLFIHPRAVQIQLRVLTTGGDAINSNIETVSCDQCLDNEVLV